jgi:hypothetical protein
MRSSQKVPGIIFTLTVWCTMSSYRLDRLVISNVQVLQWLRDAVWRKRRDKWQVHWFLHHDNPPSHISLVVQQFLAEKNLPVMTHPQYSPDLSPLKMELKGTRSATTEDLKLNAKAELQKIPKEALEQWQDRWSKCVCVQGSYFESD